LRQYTPMGSAGESSVKTRYYEEERKEEEDDGYAS
jgi:hypothetical protein